MVSFFTYCRPPDIRALLLVFFSFTGLLLTHHSALSYHYDVGDYAVGCPDDWFNVGDRCFHLVDDNVYRWVEGGTKCSQVKGLNSRALHNDNWFLIRDLSAAIRGLSSSKEQFWTGFFVESDQSGALPATIQQADSANEISMYSPIWNEIQPQLAMLVNSSRLCIMLDVAVDEPERYGWTLKNCEEDFPIICETFGCPQEQYRCTDNSACIPQKAVCDGIIDCEDKDDEQNCNCKCDERQTTFNETYGSIRTRGDDQDSCAPTQCSWEIKQTPGTRIRLNLMSMKSSDSGHVRVEGLDSGEIFALQPNGPATIQTSGSHLRVRYVNNSTKPASGGFHLQYIGDDSTSCVRRFESWNGTFSPPMHVHRKDRYRSSTNCMWVIDNQDGQPLSIQIPLFKLATGDYFLIYDGKIAPSNLMGNYSASNEPPSLFVSMQKEVTFRFWAAPTTPGDLGFLVAFERTCIDQHVKQGHGQIQSPAFHQPNARVPFECSWIVDVPCTADTCGLTVYFDALNLTNMDQITLRSASDLLTLDGSTLPMSFRATSPELRISMRGLTQQFAAKLTFSGDCPTEQVPNAAPQDSTKAVAMFRDQTEFQCDNPTKGSQFLATCLLGGLWQTSGFSACQNADATSTCVVKKLPNGWITKLDRQSGQMTYECSRGFRAASSGVAQCTNGEWTPEPKCEPITCGPLESEPLPTSPPDEGIVEAVPSESASSFPVYKRVKYECADNNRYALRGTANYRQCLESGEWTYPEIFCQELKCGLNSTIKYSDNRPYEMKVAESDALICRPGYNSSLSNAGNEFTCKKAEPSLYDPDLSSVWCTPYDFCSNPNVCLPDGQCEALYNGYFCDCKQGYEDTDGQCTDIDECSLKISDCTNAKCVNQPGTYDCSCEQGFIPPTKEVAVSEKSSVIPDVTCIPTRCPIPVAPAEDRYMVTDDPLFEPSTSVKFYMNARPGPVHRMRCLPNGTWESLLPNKQLSLITCPMFPLASAVIAEPTNAIFRLYERVNFSCFDESFELIGPSEAVCLSTGQMNIQKSPLCLQPQCSDIDVDGRPGLTFTVHHNPFSIKGQNLTVNTTLEFDCLSGYILDGQHNFTCKLENNVPVWSPTHAPMPSYRSSLVNTPNSCALNVDEDVLPSRYILNVGEAATFKCLQPNYALSHNQVSVCKRRATRKRRAANCIAKWNSTSEAKAGSAMQLYCELSQFCSNMHLTWRNERRGYELTNVARVAGDSGPGIVATISPTFAADEGPYICEARDSNGRVVDTARTFIKLTDEKTATSWREVLNNAIPSKFRIFDSRNIKAGWNHSAHWNQLPDATFQFTPMPAAKDWLTSPVIQVDAKWIEVSAEIGGCADCSISLHYFSAETPLENIRLKDFTPLGSATVGPLTHTIQFLLPFSLAWLMIAVDTKSKPMRLERLALTSMSCPNVRIGNTAFPETLVLSTNVTVNGVCAQHPSSSGLSQLICSPQGRWFAIHDQEPASACDCPPGQMNVNGRCTKDGMKCLVCDTASPDECAAHSQLITCDAGERCSTQIWRQFNGELLLRKSCAANCFARFDNLDHCRAGQEPFCELCCEKDGCNTERPIATTTQPPTTTTTTTTPSTTTLLTTTEIVDTELTYLDPPPPHCVDQQTLQLSCVEVIHVVRSSSGFVEPAPVPWPTITDNDPSIRLDVNLPGLSQEPYAFDGTESEVRWTATDRHGITASCTTRVVFQDSEPPKLQCPEHHHVEPVFNSASGEIAINLPKITITDSSSTQTVYQPQNGTLIPMDTPIKVNVTVVDGSGNMAHCQFWYTAETADCPLWRVDGTRYACRREGSISVCYPRSQCTTREIPPNVKALVCIPGHGWRMVDGGTEAVIAHLTDVTKMRTSPVCLEEISSTVTLSLGFAHGTLDQECSGQFAQQMVTSLENFLGQNCPEVQWTFGASSQVDQGRKLSINYTTHRESTKAVLNCINDITDKIPIKKLPCVRRPVLTTVLYHLKCPAGWGANHNLKCEKCPPGYFVQDDACTPCAVGSYSLVEQSAQCTPCPPGMSTRFDGSASEQECVDVCPPGFFSTDKGLAPCNPCPRGSFQSELGQESCFSCSVNRTTASVGAKSANECQVQCPPGSFGLNGIEPCRACPVGHYQDRSGSSKCERCPEGSTTVSSGSPSKSNCIDVSCQVAGCKNGGTCVNQQCRCLAGFTGPNCGVAIDTCQAAFCVNGGICNFVPEVGAKCTCPQGITGQRCEFFSRQQVLTDEHSIVKREEDRRSSTARSTWMPGSPSWHTTTPHQFDTSSPPTFSSFIPTFDTSPYTNSTEPTTFFTWYDNSTTHRVKRTTPTSTTRTSPRPTTSPTPSTSTHSTQKRTISTSITALPSTPSPSTCGMNTCPNGRCTSNATQLQFCTCDEGFEQNEQLLCVEDSPCDWNVCDPEHTLNNNTRNPERCCECMDGYEGDFCERPIGCCISSLDCGLQNGNVPAVCIFETEFSFCGVCYYQCDKAFWLKSCNPSDKPKKFRCEEKECGANGTCAYDEKGIPFCQCDPGVIGENCEKPVSKCSPRNPNPLKCKRGGRCREDDNGAICQCQTGSTGPTCTEDAIPCGTSSCQNGGQCEQMIDGVYCACPPGFFGESCEEEIDPCEVRKEVCGHGKCITIAKGYDGQYKCECDNGWDPSTNCQTPVDPCVSSSCKAGSTCQPIDSTSYVCLCPDGMQGEKCDQQIDLCIQGVCLNGGTCKQYKDQDQTLQFRCDCPEGIHGDNCELLPDPCNAIHCQHNGYCVSTDSTAVCKCVDNYSGKFCEKPPSLCDEANYCNSGECIRADDGYDYCNCPPTFTGLRCETQKTDNYNFLFTGIQTKHKQTITSGALSDYSFNTAFTLCSWIKYGTDSNGNVKPKASASDESVVVRVDSSTDGTQWIPAALLTTSGITASGTRVIAHEMPWNEWHHVTIELDLQKRVLSLRIDGVVQQSHSVSDFDQSGSFRVVLGENMDGSQQFVGEISLVQVFDRLFTDDLYSEMVVDCPSFSNQQFPELVIPWTGYTTVDEYNDAVLSVYPGICVTSTCLPGRADCSADHDKVPPTVLNCPSTQHIVSNERLRVVTWPDDPQQMFKDNDMIVSVDSNFRSGQSFTWGVYHVVYVAKDRAGNIAICSFDIVVAPQDCSEPVSTNSVTVNMTTIADESQQIKELGVVSCSQDGFVFTQDRPPFYVCDLMGRWDRFANIGTRYNLPSCSSTVNPLQTLDGNMDIDSCDEVEKTRTQLRNAIIETGFCDSPDCDGQLEITDSCDRFRRFPRQVDSSFTSTTFIVYYQLNVTTTPYAVKPVLEEKFNATFGADAPNIDTRFDCYMDDHPQLHFSPHLHDTTKDKFQCASCPPGQYYDDEAKKCLLCPIDTYKKDEGVGDCTPCPANTITGNKTGSTDPLDCFEDCSPGNFFDLLNGVCTPCPLGQYMPDSGRLKCTACPVQYTTHSTGSTSLADCDVRCDPGSELDDSEQCVQCPTGTYRSDEMTVCRKCNRGFETQGPGAPASSSCNVVFCPAGHAEKAGIGAVNQDTASFDQVCELCDIGYYQPDEGSKACEKCPTGKTTAQRGSTSVDYCTVDGGLSCTPSHADQCPPGTECVQVDSGGYECRTLSTTTSPIRHPLPAWVWIVIVCVVMICILVVAFLSILYRERLLRYCDDHCPGLLRCWKLKEGGRRFSLNPTRDTTALPFTPNDLPANRTEEAARVPNESGAEVWSNLSSERASRWSGNRPHSLDYAHPDDPTALNNPEANALDEIRSGLIDVMESGSVESVASNHTTPPPAPPNHGLRVETRPPTFAALSQRRSLTRRQANGPFGRMDSAEMTTEAKFAAQINSSGRSFAWAHQRDSPTALRNKPGGQSTVAPYHPAGPTSQARPAFEDDDNDFFC